MFKSLCHIKWNETSHFQKHTKHKEVLPSRQGFCLLSGHRNCEDDLFSFASRGFSRRLTKQFCKGIHHGFIGVSSSLELNGAEGIGGAELCVFADGPLLGQAVILGQTLCLIILTR